MPRGVAGLSCHLLRLLTIEHCGFDPGEIAHDTRLADVRLVGLNLMTLVAVLEDLYGVDFPTDLVGALETADDLTYFTGVKVDQRQQDRLMP